MDLVQRVAAGSVRNELFFDGDGDFLVDFSDEGFG